MLCTLMLVLSLFIKFTSKGPILFRQERHGLNRRKFTMLKFRTMVENADQMKDLLPRKMKWMVRFLR